MGPMAGGSVPRKKRPREGMPAQRETANLDAVPSQYLKAGPGKAGSAGPPESPGNGERQGREKSPGHLGRPWPPTPHRLPVTANVGRETTAMSKSRKVTLLDFYRRQLEENRGKQESEFHWVYDALEEFDLTFYASLDVMNMPEKRMDNLVVLVNGLNEIDYIHFSHYDRIGAYLAPREIGAVLHATPFHLSRTAYLDQRFKADYMDPEKRRQHAAKKFTKAHAHPGRGEWEAPLQDEDEWAASGGYLKRKPHYSMIRDPLSIFRCFEQTAQELISLADFLTGGSDPCMSELDISFYDKIISRTDETKVSLLGYSMGGLQALYAFLINPGLFHRCVLVNSGAAVTELQTRPVQISDEHWDKIKEQMLWGSTMIPEAVTDPGLLVDLLLNRAFKRPHVAARFKEVVDRLLFVAGGADIVASSKYLAQFVESPDHVPPSGGQSDTFAGLNIFQIAGLEHLLRNSPMYDRWFPVIMGVIENFLKVPEGDRLSYDELMIELGAGFDKGEQSWWEEAEQSLAEDGNIDQAFFEELPTSTTSRHDFLTLYVVSKRYFERDRDLIRALRRRRTPRKAKVASS